MSRVLVYELFMLDTFENINVMLPKRVRHGSS
jgi:hypothetical protein